jgi:hypothetical protein
MTTATLPTARALLDGAADDLLLPLADWAAVLPGRRRNSNMSKKALLRWHIAGVRGHRLPTRRIGHRHLVLGRDLRKFLAAIAPDAARPAPRPSARAAVRVQQRRAALARRAAAEALR